MVALIDLLVFLLFFSLQTGPDNMASTASAARAQGASPARSNELHANKILHKIYITCLGISFLAKGDANKTGRPSTAHRHKSTNMNTQ